MDDNCIWVGTTGGLVKIDNTSDSTTFFNKANSGLPADRIFSIAIDDRTNMWIGTWMGLAKFDGENWTVYDTSNSGLADKYVLAIGIDRKRIKWNTGNIASGIYFYRLETKRSLETKKLVLIK